MPLMKNCFSFHTRFLTILLHRNEVDHQVCVVDVDYWLGLAVNNVYNAPQLEALTNEVLLALIVNRHMTSLGQHDEMLQLLFEPL